jgi:hypothetical protein
MRRIHRRLSAPVQTGGAVRFEYVAVAVMGALSLAMLYVVYTLSQSKSSVVVVAASGSAGGFGESKGDALSDLYAPPLKSMEGGDSARGLPINMRTRGSPADAEYSQIGILKRAEAGANTILPLFGRKSDTSRNNYQYFAMSNSGVVNTKLPVIVNGRQGTSETGVSEIGSGDSVFVDGYDADFKATVYENSMHRYLPW